jgi:hypothetical protein
LVSGVAESDYETVSESLVALFPIRRNHSVIQQRRFSSAIASIPGKMKSPNEKSPNLVVGAVQKWYKI